MLKKIATTIVAMMIGSFIYTNTVFAVAIDAGSEYLTHTINNIGIHISGDVITPFNKWEIGIYGFNTDSLGNVTRGNMLSVVNSDPNTQYDLVGVNFDSDNNTATSTLGGTADIGSNFGIYFKWLRMPNCLSYIFTHSDMNFNGNDSVWIADDSDFDSVVGSDFFTLGIRGAIPGSEPASAPVPEPATCLLMGLGMLGLITAKYKKLV